MHSLPSSSRKGRTAAGLPRPALAGRGRGEGLSRQNCSIDGPVPPHPDRICRCDIAEAKCFGVLKGRPPAAAYASPRKRGEVEKAAAVKRPSQLSINLRTRTALPD